MTGLLDAATIVADLRRAATSGATRSDLLALTAQRIHKVGPPYTGVYLYMLHDGALKLEAHAGPPTPHQEISVHHGLCGRAVREARDINVADVGAEPDYLACSVTTRAELICLVRSRGEVIGQIDIDSDVPAGFPPEEEAAVRLVADALGDLL